MNQADLLRQTESEEVTDPEEGENDGEEAKGRRLRVEAAGVRLEGKKASRNNSQL